MSGVSSVRGEPVEPRPTVQRRSDCTKQQTAVQGADDHVDRGAGPDAEELGPLQCLKLPSGTRLRLFTRSPEGADKRTSLNELGEWGARIHYLPSLHAKAAVWIGFRHDDVRGYVGSHNLTLSSDTWANELGLVFTGRGTAEARLLRDLCAAFDGWELLARRQRAA